jgi:hypothetical protein
MPLLLVIGGILILFGLALFVAWFGFFWALFKALLPLFVIALGGLLTYFGWEERKDSKGAFIDFSSPDEASRYQAEALAYQEKISSLSGPDSESGGLEPEILVEHRESVALIAEPVPAVEASIDLKKPKTEVEESGTEPGTAEASDASSSDNSAEAEPGPAEASYSPSSDDSAEAEPGSKEDSVV